MTFNVKIFYVLLTINNLNIICEGSNILTVLPTPLKSHIKGFTPFFVELAKRGHNVTIYTPYPIQNTLPNYHQVVLKEMGNLIEFDLDKFVTTEWSFFTLPIKMWKLGEIMVKETIQQPEIQDLMKSCDTKFDLIFTEQFYQEAYEYIGHRFNAPVIHLLPIAPLPFVSYWDENPISCGTKPDQRLGFPPNMNLIQRLKNCIFVFMEIYVSQIFYLPIQQQLADKYFKYEGSENKPDLSVLLRNSSLSLIHSDRILFEPATYVPSYIEVSAFHTSKPGKLPQDLQKIMDDSKSGVIYFSFGSLVKSSHIPQDKLDIIIQVFSKLPQTVLWKFNSKTIPKLPKNIIIQKWFPQIEILAHENTKLFITHGGLHSIMETVYYGVPVLGIPFFSDQTMNLLYGQKNGYARIIDRKNFTLESLSEVISDLLYNPIYEENARALSARMKDRPLSPMDTAIYWTEYVLRNKWSTNFQIPDVHVPLYQQYLIDVIFILVILPILVIISIWKLFIKLCKKKPKLKKQ